MNFERVNSPSMAAKSQQDVCDLFFDRRFFTDERVCGFGLRLSRCYILFVHVMPNTALEPMPTAPSALARLLLFGCSFFSRKLAAGRHGSA
jgi:hypothetical protein